MDLDVGGGADVGADAVDLEIVGVGALAVDDELARGGGAGGGDELDARGEFEQRLEGAPIEGEVFGEAAVDGGGDGDGGLLDEGIGGGDLDALGERAELQLEVAVHLGVRIDGEGGQTGGLKALAGDADSIAAGVEARQEVGAIGAGEGEEQGIGGERLDFDAGARDRGAGRVRHPAAQSGGAGGARGGVGEQKQSQREDLMHTGHSSDSQLSCNNISR